VKKVFDSNPIKACSLFNKYKNEFGLRLRHGLGIGLGLGLREHLIAIRSRFHEEQSKNLHVKCEKIFDVSLQHLAEIISLNQNTLVSSFSEYQVRRAPFIRSLDRQV
jgi:hypothetical protein